MAKAEYAIDLHAGDLVEDLTPFVIYRETGEAGLDGRIKRMVDAYGARYAVKSAPTGERPGSLYAVAALNGVAAMLAESGGRGLLIEEDVVRHVRGVTNILRAIGAIDGVPDRVAPTTVLQSFDWLRSPAEGMFHCAVRVDQQVREGDVVGELTDLVGEPIVTVRAQTDGVVLFIVTSPAIKKDGLLLAIGAL